MNNIYKKINYISLGLLFLIVIIWNNTFIAFNLNPGTDERARLGLMKINDNWKISYKDGYVMSYPTVYDSTICKIKGKGKEIFYSNFKIINERDSYEVFMDNHIVSFSSNYNFKLKRKRNFLSIFVINEKKQVYSNLVNPKETLFEIKLDIVTKVDTKNK